MSPLKRVLTKDVTIEGRDERPTRGEAERRLQGEAERPIKPAEWKQLEKRFDNLMSKPTPFLGSPREKNEVMDLSTVEYAMGNAADFIDGLYYHSTNFGEKPSSIILNHLTPSENSLLHVAASSGSAGIVKLLVRFFPILITSANCQGDTALHASARAGNNNSTLALIEYVKEHPGDDLLKKKNKKGNTPLHEAVIKRHRDVAETLIKADPIVAYKKNGEIKSPLYLAAQNNDQEMVLLILKAVEGDEYPTSKLEGKSPANAALQNRNLDILKDMARIKPDLIRHKDEKEDIPLHFASKMGFHEGVEQLLEKHRAGAFERNKKGHYPIHAACRKGHVIVVNRLLREWPDPMELLTINGQSVLHISAERGRENMVDGLLKNPEVEKIVNEKDEDGNTALHLAAKQGRSMALFTLLKNKKVDWQIRNNDDMAPYQIVEQEIKKLDDKYDKVDTYDEKSEDIEMKKKNQLHQPNYYEVMMASAILHFHGSRRKGIDDYLRLQSKPLSKEELKSRRENLLVVAILVASVTFAGAIQIPGNGDKDDNTFSLRNQIAATNDALLKAYIYVDVIALNASLMASLILCWPTMTNHLSWLASILIGFSLYMMCVQFVIAASIALSGNAVTVTLLLFVSSLLFLIQMLLCFPLIIPPNGTKVVEKFLLPFIYYVIFGVYYVFQKSLNKLPNHHEKK